MIDQTKRVTEVVKGELHKLTLGKEPVGFGVGYSFGDIPLDDKGAVYAGPIWMVVVTMRNPLLGQPDISMSLPVLGPMPDDDMFKQCVGRLLGECRKEYAKALNSEVKAAA